MGRHIGRYKSRYKSRFGVKDIGRLLKNNRYIAIAAAAVLVAAGALLAIFSGGGNARESMSEASPNPTYAVAAMESFEATQPPALPSAAPEESASAPALPKEGSGEEAKPEETRQEDNPEETKQADKPEEDDKKEPEKTDKAKLKTASKGEGKPKTPDLSKLVAEFEVKSDKYYNDTSFSSNHYEYTGKELKMLATVIYLEARNQPYKCQVAVGNVVMNRVLARGYPGSNIEEVVTRKNQFCYNASTQPNSECMRVARDILDYEVWTVPQNTYFFRANPSKEDWGDHDYFTHYGNTAFYRDRYSGRYNGETIPDRLYERVYRWPQYGCKPGSRVKKIQKMLKSLGYKVSTDGYFGMDTKEALMKFQKSKRLKADGVAGQATIKALIRKYGVEKYMKL